MAKPRGTTLSPSRIAAVVAQISAETGISYSDIRSLHVDRAPGRIVAARWRVWRRLCEVDGFCGYAVARAWGCDPTSILNAKRRGWTPTLANPAPVERGSSQRVIAEREEARSLASLDRDWRLSA